MRAEARGSSTDTHVGGMAHARSIHVSEESGLRFRKHCPEKDHAFAPCTDFSLITAQRDTMWESHERAEDDP
uniref:Uncharacterized protein n=1 Tax=Knipowitschia caucasica TaxID=637954 RepID=A0AAV2LZW0_KNICA